MKGRQLTVPLRSVADFAIAKLRQHESFRLQRKQGDRSRE